MLFYVARQPILDSHKQLVGYELLFRDGLKNAFPDINPHEATSRLISGSHFNLGLDNITDGHPAFINFPELSLLVRVPEILPKETVVIEILEDTAPSQEMVEVCAKLKAAGYRIALDDFVYDASWRPLMPYVDMVKIDLLAHDRPTLFRMVKALREFNVTLLAEKVETHDEFQYCLTLGFTLFQGYFFARPEVMQRQVLSPSRINMLELLGKLGANECQFSEIESIISRDLSLTFKLLRHVNSAAFAKQKDISSIHQALVYLGEAELRKFIAILAAANLGADKPDELLRMSVTRARFCELLAQQRQDKNAAKAFLVGLFSLLGTLLDAPLEQVLERLPVADDIKAALLGQGGPLGPYLELMLDYERAIWDGVQELSRRLGLNQQALPDVYLDAVGWGHKFTP